MGTSTVNISANQVKELREKTGAPMMDCKQALTEAKGDLEQAVILLRKRGVSVAAKKATRVTSEGSVASYIHAGGKIGVLLEVSTTSDEVVPKQEFHILVRDIAMQIAAAAPQCVSKADVAQDLIEKERDIQRERARGEGKPEKMLEKIVEGRMSKFYEEVCLLEQPFIRENTITVGDLIRTASAKLGGSIGVARFVRYKVGDAMDAPGVQESPLPVTA